MAGRIIKVLDQMNNATNIDLTFSVPSIIADESLNCLTETEINYRSWGLAAVLENYQMPHKAFTLCFCFDLLICQIKAHFGLWSCKQSSRMKRWNLFTFPSFSLLIQLPIIIGFSFSHLNLTKTVNKESDLLKSHLLICYSKCIFSISFPDLSRYPLQISAETISNLCC